jgi:tRNA A-37 threonylcarbamoyl transferase component Bud32
LKLHDLASAGRSTALPLTIELADGADPHLSEAWQAIAHQAPLTPDQQNVLAEALTALAVLHAKGLWLADLTFDKFVCHKHQVQVVEAALRAENSGTPLSRSKVLENLGRFFAHLPVVFEPFIEELLIHYLLANGEHALPLEVLLQEVAKMRRERQRTFISEVSRDGSVFCVKRGLAGLLAVVRTEEQRLQAILDDPEAAIRSGTPLKLGDSTTVVKVDTAAGPVVLKRYNIMGWRHRLRRCLVPTRAWRCWVSGHRLDVLGIATPKPLAMLERRCCGLRGRSYLITEFLEAPDLLAHLQPHTHAAPPEPELRALEQLFATLLRERISHGDFKDTNLLWDRDHWSMIDLDSMRQHRFDFRFRRAYAKDRARVLQNWAEDSELYRMVDVRLPRYEL